MSIPVPTRPWAAAHRSLLIACAVVLGVLAAVAVALVVVLQTSSAGAAYGPAPAPAHFAPAAPAAGGAGPATDSCSGVSRNHPC